MYSKLKRTAGEAVRLHKSVTHGIRSRTDPLLIGESFAFLSFFLGCICECNQRVKYFYLNVHLISSAVVVNPLTHSTPLWPAICHFLYYSRRRRSHSHKKRSEKARRAATGKSSAVPCYNVPRSWIANCFQKEKKKQLNHFLLVFIISPVK